MAMAPLEAVGLLKRPRQTLNERDSHSSAASTACPSANILISATVRYMLVIAGWNLQSKGWRRKLALNFICALQLPQ